MLIREKFETHSFSNTERLIIDFILEKRFEIKEMTTKDIANATFSSPSTLIRIAHKMEFSGWNELKEAYLKEEEYLASHFNEIDANMPFTAQDSLVSISNKIARLKEESIEDTLSLIDYENLQKAIDLIEKSSGIQIFAISNNINLAKEFQHNMSRLQKRVDLMSSQGEYTYAAMNMDPTMCAILISYSGETTILANVSKILNARKIPYIAITNIGDNTISNNSDVTLRITTREKMYSKIANYSTSTSISYLLDVLYSCIFAQDYEKNLKLKMRNS
ncbi:MAG: MurR/RpiR family transcriptional regulator, partial [Firmicutes bacterium]|nr:MurR/RpiR family transcriptional regulator [Bacillota bacterium]